MKARDVFKIVVATVGLLGFSYGALYLIDGEGDSAVCRFGVSAGRAAADR
jgi:hypothetical protein